MRNATKYSNRRALATVDTDTRRVGWALAAQPDPGAAPSRHYAESLDNNVIFAYKRGRCRRMAQDLWVWGKSLNGGRVEQNTQKHSDKPARQSCKFSAVAAGADFCLAISSSGQLYGWGSNITMLRLAESQTAIVPKPQPIEICAGQKIIAIAAGVHHAAAITAEHDLVYWSDQTGPETAAPPPSTMGRFVAVSCGSHHSLALTDLGQLFTWGQGEGGVLGFGHEEEVPEPSPLIVLDPVSMTPLVFKAISAGGLHSMAIDSWGRCWAWGFNADGRLGLGGSSLFTHLTPTLVTTIRTPSGLLKSVGTGFFGQVSAGYSASALLDSNGNLYFCGKNEDGVLGLGYVSQRCVFPTAVTKLDTTAGPVTSFGVKFVSLSVSRYMSAALTENGLLYTFGSSGAFLGVGISRLGHPSLPSPLKSKPGCLRPMVVPQSEKTHFSRVSLGWDNVVAVEGVPPGFSRPTQPAPSTQANPAPRFLKLYMFGETMTFLFDPDTTVRQVLERAGSKIADFDINKCIPKDSNGQELSLDMHLKEISGSEIFFKQLRPAALPLTKRFTVHFGQDQKNSILWRPALVVRDVLEKMCNNRGVILSHFVAKDMFGNPIDLNMTLDKLLVDEITFNTKANIEAGVRVLLQGDLQHSLRFNGELHLSELLCRVCENRDLCVWKFVPKNVEGVLLDPSRPLSQLTIPQNIIDFSTPRTSLWFKELQFASGLAKKVGLELRSAVHRCRPRSNQLSSSVGLALEQAVAALTAEFVDHDVISLSDQTISPQLQDRPTWLVHIAGLSNLINGLPGVALCISLIKHDKPRVGVVYDVGQGDIYFAEENAGAFCGDAEILNVSPKIDLLTSVVAVAPFSSTPFDRLISACPRVRNWGIPELEMCYVARGRLDACVYFNVSVWSVAATSLIVQEALGIVVDADSPSSSFSALQSRAIIASNPSLSESIMQLLADSTPAVSDELPVQSESDINTPIVEKL